MKYYITTDTHFGHNALRKYCGRPDDADNRIMNNHESVISKKDILIHLGDFCIGNDAQWHSEFFRRVRPLKAYLIRGNHDRKSPTWYHRHGWDFVGDSFTLQRNNLNILFSHLPVKDNGYDVNIHGHFHNSDHRRHEPELSAIKTSKHILLMLEHEYIPRNLNKILKY